MLLGMSQGKLGDALGLTFQQVQKYEHGVNRITAGMLYQLSRTLDVPISFFFDCYENADGQSALPRAGADTPIEGEAQISRREARMLRLWRGAPDSVANEMLGLLTSLALHSRLSDEEDLEEEGDDETEDDGGMNASSDEMSETARAKRRRRRGAAWDPADIE